MTETEPPLKPYKCARCGKGFATLHAKEAHKIDAHNPQRRLLARDRETVYRGDVKCGYPRCRASFHTEFDATQHRQMVHGETPE